MEDESIGKNNYSKNTLNIPISNMTSIGMEKRESFLDTLKSFEIFVRLKFGDSLICIPVITDGGERFISIYNRLKSTQSATAVYGMRYLPLFYVIGAIDENSELSLKLITFHGKIIDELKVSKSSNMEHNAQPSDNKKVEFIQRLKYLRLCQGSKIPDNERQAFSDSCLIEQLEDKIIIRSRDCKYAILENETDFKCEMCASLNTTEPIIYTKEKKKRRKLKKKHSEDGFTIFNEDEGSITDPSQYDDNQGYFKPELELPNVKEEDTDDEYLEDEYQNGYNYDGGGSDYRPDSRNLEYNETDFDDEWTPHSSNFDETQLQTGICDAPSIIPGENPSPEMSKNAHRTFKCKHCTYVSTEKQQIVKHISLTHRKIKQRTFKCKYCEYKTSDKPELIQHIQETHDPEKPYSCDLCAFKTKEKRTLVQHIVAVHDKSKSYLCEQCSYATPSKGRLSCHIKAVHDKAKPFICELCSMALSAKAHLDNHIAVVHNKIKPFKCDQCPYRAANSRDMARHIKEVHEKVKPYMCNMCPYKAGRRTLLVKHLTKMHNESKLPTRKVKYNKEPNPNSNLGYYKNKPDYELAEFKSEQGDL